ncbi:MAG: hypothetical protein RL685_3235 [Pseudomonadota bacterium]|jgi:hypothetical protein
MSKKETTEVKDTLDSEQLESVLGGAGLSNLSSFQLASTGSRIATRDMPQPDLLQGFQQPVVRPSDRLRVVNPDWVSDSISVEVACVGWSKDYDDPPSDPPPNDPDGGTGGGGGGGGAPGRLDGIDLGNIDLGRLGDQLGRGGLNRR